MKIKYKGPKGTKQKEISFQFYENAPRFFVSLVPNP